MTDASKLTLRRISYDPARWRQIFESHPDSEVYHSPEWLAYLNASQGAEPVVAEVHDHGRLVGHFVGAIVKRYGLRILGSPLSGWGTQVMGFLLDEGVNPRHAADALPAFAFRTLGCAHLELNDRKLTDENMTGSGYTMRSDHTYLIDLEDSEDAILARMHSRTRTYVRRAMRNGLEAELVTSVAFADEFYEQLQDVFASSQLVPTYGVERVRLLIDHLLPSGQVLLVRVRDKDARSLATAVIIASNKRATMWGAAFPRAYTSLHPNEILQWEIMRVLKARGIAKYDLSGPGSYKGKYGGPQVQNHMFYRSRIAALDWGREAVRTAFYCRQRVLGRIKARTERVSASGAELDDAE